MGDAIKEEGREEQRGEGEDEQIKELREALAEHFYREQLIHRDIAMHFGSLSIEGKNFYRKQAAPILSIMVEQGWVKWDKEKVAAAEKSIENILTGMHNICGRWDNDTDTCLVAHPQNCPGWFLCKSKEA